MSRCPKRGPRHQSSSLSYQGISFAPWVEETHGPLNLGCALDGLFSGLKAGLSALVDDEVAAGVAVVAKVADVELALPVGGDGFPVVGVCALYLEDTEDLAV